LSWFHARHLYAARFEINLWLTTGAHFSGQTLNTLSIIYVWGKNGFGGWDGDVFNTKKVLAGRTHMLTLVRILVKQLFRLDKFRD